jgi:hypothetical protein
MAYGLGTVMDQEVVRARRRLIRQQTETSHWAGSGGEYPTVGLRGLTGPTGAGPAFSCTGWVL